MTTNLWYDKLQRRLVVVFTDNEMVQVNPGILKMQERNDE